jgi:hypothetical protein
MGVPGNASPLLLTSAAGAAAGYQISRSVRFNSSDSAYLSRTPASAGNRKTWTWAGWVKLTKNTSQQYIFGGTQDNYNVLWTLCAFYQDKIYFQSYSGGFQFNLQTTQVFRDYSAWYHIVVAVDTTQATSADRVKLYVNGTQITSYVTASYPSQNVDTLVNGNWLQTISGPVATTYLDAYLADIHFIDGQALDPSSFGEFDTNGVWQPMAYTGSYGTNGFRLPFSDNSAATATTLGKDSAGSNNWTPNNLSVTAGAGNDSLVDSPMNYGTDTGAGGEVRGNYATWNPLRNDQNAVLTNGNLDLSTAGSVARYGTYTTIGVTSAKWYWEITAGALSTDGYNVGIASASKSATSALGSDTDSYIYLVAGTKRTNNVTLSYGASYTAGDVIGVALDLDAGTLTFYKNGVSQGTAYTSIPTNTWFPTVADDATGSTTGSSFIANFGQRPFAYTAPSGFKALTTANLPTPLIEDGSTVMDVKLYTGNGSTQTISGLNFSPDFVWLKARSAVDRNIVTDIVRGVTNTLNTDDTRSEASATEASQVTAYTSTGFTVGSNGNVNGSSVSFVAWTWDAGTSTVSNTAGSITSQVRANASAGFSVVTYTGTGANATVGHGLGVAPRFMAIKNRTAFEGWINYHSSIGPTNFLQFNTTNASSSNPTVFNDTAPTSNVFSVGTIANTNGSAANFVAYCFAPVDGYSSFGSYTGNGSANGPFVFLGFRPAVVMVKMSSSTGNWTILDDKREGYNVDNDPLFPNLVNAEGTTDLIDITSNGFKVRTTDATFNTNAGTYIYAAWASSPFAYSRAR